MAHSFAWNTGNPPSMTYTDDDGHSYTIEFERVQARVPNSPYESEVVLVPTEKDPEILDSSEAMEYIAQYEQEYNIKILPRSAIDVVDE